MTKDMKLQAIDKKVLFIILAHIPFVAFLAPIGYGTSAFAIGATAFITVLSLVGYFTLSGTRWFGVLTGAIFMLFSATLIQTQLGRIEMHFHIFVALAFLLIYKDWLVVVTAAAVGAVHHLVLTYIQLNGVEIGGMPIMLFNYDCSWSITFLHALFVVVESAVLIYYAVTMKKEEDIANNVVDTINRVSEKSDFSLRVHGDNKNPSVRATNTLMQSIENAIAEINQVMASIAKGDFGKRINHDFSGDLDKLKNAVNASAGSVTETMTSLEELMHSLGEGDFSARLDNRVKGSLRAKVNDTMQTMDLAVAEVGEVINRLSEGDLSARVEAELKGALNDLKQNTNTSMQRLQVAIEEIAHVIEAQSNGDLTISVNKEMHGELHSLKEAINRSNHSLNQVISQVIDSSTMVRNASSEVSTGNNNLNDRTQQQAASLEQTAASMEELTSTIKQNTDNAMSADQLAKNASHQAQSSRKVMNETEEAIHKIHDSSKQIEEITVLIDSIAFQTNLLALNAAVEAARAGEHGRGFAVVAGEVRSLAGKSADAAKDIKSLIENSVRSIQTGTEKMALTSESLTKINDSIQQVSDIVAEISAASQEQQQGVTQINAAVADIDNGTQQNAALVEETTAASESMSHETEKLSQVVSTFKVK